jgi:hypothetical protein
MQDVLRSFNREGQGRWICRQSCSFESPVGRVQVAAGTRVERGLRFLNFDLAAALEAEYEKQKGKIAPG